MNPPPDMHSARSRWLEALDDLFFEENQDALAREAERQKRESQERPYPEPQP